MRKKIFRKVVTVALATTMIMSTSIMAFASSRHYGEASNEVGDFKTIMEYDYSDGSWSSISYYDTSVLETYDDYELGDANTDWSDSSGSSDYDVYHYGNYRGTLTVRTTLDIYGNIDDFVLY